MRILISKNLITALLLTASFGISYTVNAESLETQTRTYSYDSNKDGFIEPDEFTTYIYTRSDTNGDGYLGDEEWKMTTSQLYRPYKDINYNTYTYWDRDKDNRLDHNEMKTLIQKTDLYSKWDTDTDGKISNAEFEKGTFDAYDDNRDGLLSRTEWISVLR